MYESECPTAKEQNEIQNNAQGLELNKPCEKCKVEDDEYCIYNQCYFDKQYRLLKQELQPNANQENCLDNIYMNFKQDLEILCERYTKEKDKLLDLISKDVKCIKEQKNTVHDIQTDIKEKYKDYLSDTNEILCKNQKKIFKSFKKDQNKKIKKIKKYGAVYKFPCS
ncbi:MAG: hypothetical protein IJ877_07285 [Candidatus Gastranaerophilales bacterium]|nr:hypothetical protein [Candidatus Gastranaerophilales bacterium]